MGMRWRHNWVLDAAPLTLFSYLSWLFHFRSPDLVTRWGHLALNNSCHQSRGSNPCRKWIHVLPNSADDLLTSQNAVPGLLFLICPVNILLRNLLEDFSQAIAAVPVRICPLIRPPCSKSASWSNGHKRSFPPDHLLHLFTWDYIKNPSYSQELLARHLLFSDSEPACSVCSFILWMNVISLGFCPRAPGPLLLVPCVCPSRLQRTLSRPPSPPMILCSGSLGDPPVPTWDPSSTRRGRKAFSLIARGHILKHKRSEKKQPLSCYLLTFNF